MSSTSVVAGVDATRREFLLGISAFTAIVLAGCGGEDGSRTRMRTIEDAFGETEVPLAPTRVIADSVSTMAHLESLGLTPIAVARPQGISADYIGDDADEVRNVVAEDGWTVDLEEALQFDPELIVAVGADYNRENCERYGRAVPTFSFVEVTSSGTDADIKETLVGIALALGREDQAAEAIAGYDRRVAALEARIAATHLPQMRFGVVRIDAGGFIGIRTTGAGPALLETLGLRQPAWPAPTVDGYVELSLETLEILDLADVLLVNTDDDVVVAESAVLTSPLWERLAAVKEGRAHLVGAWNGADLPQLERILLDLEQGLVAPAERAAPLPRD